MSPAIPLLGINPRLLLEGILIESNTLSNTLDLQGDQHKKIEDQLTLTEIIQKWTAQTEEEAIQTDKIPTDTMPHGETPGKHANPIKSTRQQKDDPTCIFAKMVKRLVDAQDTQDQSNDILQDNLVTTSYLKKLLSACRKIENRYDAFLFNLNEICTEENQQPEFENQLSESTLTEYAVFASLIDSTITSNWFPLYRKLKRETDASDASNPIYEYNLHQSQNIVELLNNVLRGMEASIFKLNLIVEECIFLELEFSQGQRIICKEDSISQVVQLFKLQFSMTVQTYLAMHSGLEEDTTDESENSLLVEYLSSLLHLLSLACQFLTKILQKTKTINEELSFSIIYLCLDICCSPSTTASSEIGMKPLKFEASNLLCTIFAKFSEQRRFIIEDVISNLASNYTKYSVYKLLDSKNTIHSHSALLFQMVISCCAEFTTESLCQDLPSVIPKVDDGNIEELIGPSRMVIVNLKNNLESCAKCVDIYLSYLFSKCAIEKGVGKKTVSSQEVNYKHLLEEVLADQLIILNQIEWPVSSLICLQTCRIFIQFLHDPSKQGETYMRNIATEWLGKLSVLLRKPRSAELQPMLSTFYELDQTKSIEYLYERTQDMQTTLLSLVMDKTLQASAVNYLYSSFCNKLPTYDDQFKLLVIDFALRLSSNLKASLSAPVSKVRVTDAHLISSFFHQIHPLWQQHDKIIISLMKGFESDSVPLRTKSIRSLGEVLNDPVVSGDLKSRIYVSISERLMDASPTVRETAIDAIGKYALEQADIALGTECCTLISARIMDVKVSVRKRVVKFFRDIFFSKLFHSSESLLVDVVKKLFLRLNDEETSVRDLVEKILIELYLPLVIANADWVDLSKDFKAGYSRKLLLLCHAETSQKGMATLFYNFLAATKSNGHKVGEIMVRTLMNCISLAGTDGDNLLIEACLSLLYQVSRVYTSAFVSHVSSIHSLIDFNAIDPTSMLILNHAVLIIREVVEKSKNLNAISMKAIQMDLQKVLEKGSQPVLKASIPCLCSVVQYQTKSSEFLVQIVQRCYMMLAKFKKSLEGGSRIPDNALRTCYRALLILVPVVSFFDFESEFRISSAEYSNLVLQHLSGGSRILDLVFELAIVFTNSFLRFEAGQIGISAIGNLFVRHPEYMIQKKSLDLMNFVFSSSNLLYHYELLQVYLNYLELQQNLNSLSTDIPPALDIDVLVGNADVLLSEGIPTAVMQTFLPNILADMLVVDFNVSLTAFKIVSTALENGLVHPIQCVPAICAMESNPEDFLAQQALGIHRKLHEKHPSFIHSKIVESVNCVYRYQKTLTSAKGVPLLGFRNENALVNPMYSLIRLQKGRRNQFLKTLVYFFDIPKGTDSIMSLDYYHFIAENLAYLDFKTQEEALHVVYFINLILSVSGESLRLTLDGYGENETPADDLLFRANCCIILLSIRNHLQKRLGFSFTQILNSEPASNHANASEKNLSVQNSVSIDFMKTSAPSEIISVFFDLMDDCLGSGDIDYSAKLLQSDELLLAGESPVSTPDSAKRNKRRTPSATPKSSGKRKKVNTE